MALWGNVEASRVSNKDALTSKPCVIPGISLKGFVEDSITVFAVVVVWILLIILIKYIRLTAYFKKYSVT